MRSGRRNILLGVVAVVGVFILLEGMARILTTVYNDVLSHSAQSSQWLRYSAQFGWEKRPNFSGLMPNEARTLAPAKYRREFDAEGFLSIDTEQVKDTRRKKILAIGDSNTFGWGVPTEMTFTEVLDDLLSDIDVINLGVTGYSSFQGYKVLEAHFDRFKPSLVVASFNFNDRRFVVSEADEDSDAKFAHDMVLRQMSVFQENLYLYRVMEFVASKIGGKREGAQGAGSWDVRQLHARVSPDRYKENLARIARFCKERGVPLVFIVLQDNPAQTAQLRAGIAALRQGNDEWAERDLKIAARSNGWFTSLGKKYLVELYERQGKMEVADVVARDGAGTISNGDKPIFLDVEYNEIMRSVGTQYGVSLVEAGAMLRDDPSLFVDYCHFDERGHRMIALSLKEAVDRLLPLPERSP